MYQITQNVLDMKQTVFHCGPWNGFLFGACTTLFAGNLQMCNKVAGRAKDVQQMLSIHIADIYRPKNHNSFLICWADPAVCDGVAMSVSKKKKKNTIPISTVLQCSGQHSKLSTTFFKV